MSVSKPDVWLDEGYFKGSSVYEYVISSQDELNLIQYASAGVSLGILLRRYDAIRIVTTNDNWIPKFSLPKGVFDRQIIKFECLSDKPISVEVLDTNGNYTIEYKKGEKGIYVNDLAKVSQWKLTNSVEPQFYDYVISSISEIANLVNSTNRSYLKDLLKKFNTIKIIINQYDIQRVNIYLPDGLLNNQIITVECKNSANVNVYKKETDSVDVCIKGTPLVYINENLEVSSKWKADNSIIERADYEYIVSSYDEIMKLSDKAGLYFQWLLKRYNRIKIYVDETNFIPENIYLPENMVAGKRVAFIFNLAQYSNYYLDVYSGEDYIRYSGSVQVEYVSKLISQSSQWILNKANVVDPIAYCYTMENVTEIVRMQNDKSGLQLKRLLERFNTIKILITNQSTISNMYLPQGLLNNQQIKIINNSKYPLKVYKNTQLEYDLYTQNTTGLYTNEISSHVSGWIVGEKFSINNQSYDYIISGKTNIEQMIEDKQGLYLQNLLTKYKSIKINVAKDVDINKKLDFYLPVMFNEGRITFENFSNRPTSIYKSSDVEEIPYVGFIKEKINFTIKATSKSIVGWISLEDYNLSKIGYMDGLLACTLPSSCINPGMKLEFRYKDKKSTLNDIEVGGFSEVIINTIDIGMLTPNRNEFTIQKDYELQRQYFQSVPVSRLIFNEYAPIHLTEVMLPDGRLLKTCDPSTGGAHDGDMRQYIGKILISLGINKANLGENDSIGSREDYRYFTPIMTAHNSVGLHCKEGVVVYGLSGGNGMITLSNSVGNEWSHEVGHSYGLGHYPNGANGSIHRPDGDINSSWGWDCNLNNFIPNFEKTITNAQSCYDDGKAIVFDMKSGNANDETEVMQCGCGCADDNENTSIQSRVKVCIPPCEGHRFNFDAMAGGWAVYNSYTLHTPYALNSIQNFLESKAMFDRSSATGFSKWNATTKTMEPISNMVNGKERKPIEQGVPVITILGYIDPSKKTGYIYPLLAGAYGMVYEALNITPTNNYIEVTYNKFGKIYKSYYELSSTNFNAGYSNMFHINIKRDFEVETYDVKVYVNNLIVMQKTLNVPLGELKYYVHGKALNI